MASTTIQWYGSPAKILWPGSPDPNKIGWTDACCCPTGCTANYFAYQGRAEVYIDYEMDGPTDHDAGITGDGFVFADEGLQSIGYYSVFYDRNTYDNAFLYQALPAGSPKQDDVRATYTAAIADFSGFAPSTKFWVRAATLDANDWSYMRTPGFPFVTPHVFTHNGGGTDNTIFGCWIDVSPPVTTTGVIIGDWTDGGLLPVVDSFAMDCVDDQTDVALTMALSRESSARIGNMIVTDAAELCLLSLMPGHYRGRVTMKLFTGALTPSEDKVLADYEAVKATVATFSGYADKIIWILSTATVEATVANKAESDSDAVGRFDHSGGGNDGDVTGYYLTFTGTTAERLIGGERFSSAITMDDASHYIDIPMKDFLWDANQ